MNKVTNIPKCYIRAVPYLCVFCIYTFCIALRCFEYFKKVVIILLQILLKFICVRVKKKKKVIWTTGRIKITKCEST